jgi:hypothetical protein
LRFRELEASIWADIVEAKHRASNLTATTPI